MEPKQVRDAIVELMTTYPNAPIRVIVDEEVVTGEYSTYMAEVFSVHHDNFIYYNGHYYDDEDELFDDWSYAIYGYNEVSEEEQREKFEQEFKDAWEEAIIIHASV